MKKLLLSFALIATATLAGAQRNYDFIADAKPSSMEAFKHLGMGIEVGTTGVGIDFSLPVVSQHLVVKTGVNFLPGVKPSMDFDFSASRVNDALFDVQNELSRVNPQIDTYNAAMSRSIPHVDPLSVTSFNDELTVSAEAKLNMTNWKLLVEYYPSAYSTFHITAGLFIGKKELIELKGTIDDEAWGTYRTLVRELPDRSNQIDNRLGQMGEAPLNLVKRDDLLLTYGYDGKTYYIDPEREKGEVKANIEINNVKPYLGIGFGRSVPQKRVGFQFDLGVWFHGTPKLVAHEENPEYDGSVKFDANDDIDDVMDVVKKFGVYPQIAFRLTGRLF